MDGAKIPDNWQSFLRLDENKKELFSFLADCVTQIENDKLVISTINSSVVTNCLFDTSMSSSNHEEVDTDAFKLGPH